MSLDKKVEVKTEVKKVRVVSATGYGYYHFPSGTVIQDYAVLIPLDSWVEAQLDAGYIVEGE